MDRNVITATVLIALIMIVWMNFLPTPQPEDIPRDPAGENVETNPSDDIMSAPAPIAVGSVPALVEGDSTITGATDGTVREITIETNMYTAVFSTQGGTLVSFKLKEYKIFEQDEQVELVDFSKGGALSLVFTTPDNRIYDTRSFVFDAGTTPDHVDATTAVREVTFTTKVGEGSLTYRYTFSPDTYEVGMSVIKQNATSFVALGGYEIVWNGGLPFTEGNHQIETTHTGAFTRTGGEVEEVILLSDSYQERSYRGNIDWIAVKNKYFMAAIIPSGATRGAELIGERQVELDDPDLRLDFVASLLVPLEDAQSDEFRLYLGPMEMHRIEKYDLGLYDTVDFGWSFFETVTRPLAKYLFIPIFGWLRGILPNYGLVIIIFSIMIKVALNPLTKKSFQSMAKMKELQPQMEAIKEKYADNPQKQQQATMKMYKEAGANPLGGCLPMLLQYPIIIALWQFLPQAIELRQAKFLWALDLSAPDVILDLPFEIPMYGAFVSGFTVLMGASMVLQMRLTPQAGNAVQAKIFMYVMPVFISVIFNKLASGLSLYYLCYNVLTAAQQKWIAHQHKTKQETAAESVTENNTKRSGGNGRARSGKNIKAKGRPANRKRR